LLGSLQNLDENGFLLLAKTKIETGENNAGLELIEKNLGYFKETQNYQNLTESYLWLGEAHYRQGQYFESAENYFKGLSIYIMYGKNAPKEFLTRILSNFSNSIKFVQNDNPNDTRISLWLFTYYIVTPDENDKAWGYFREHLSNGSNYESEFTNWVIEQVKQNEKP